MHDETLPGTFEVDYIRVYERFTDSDFPEGLFVWLVGCPLMVVNGLLQKGHEPAVCYYRIADRVERYFL